MARLTGCVGPASIDPATTATASTSPPWFGRRCALVRRVWLARSNQPAWKAQRRAAGTPTSTMALLSTKAMIQRATGGRYGARTAHSRQGHNLQALAPLPAHSPGVLAAPLGELTVLYDVITEMVHVLNPSAGLVWEACDGVSLPRRRGRHHRRGHRR